MRSGPYLAIFKSFFLGVRDPATGEVLVQSFHRPWLFGSLAPNNANWTNANGKLFTLRPRPAEHPKFPRVPPGPKDPVTGQPTYTGDVQNLPGPVGIQKNDSLWMHIGLPQVTLDDGRIVQPMVAPLILPLDGLFDLSEHGNQLAAGGHFSHGGYGPWERNIGYGLVPYSTAPTLATAEPERQQLLRNRTASRTAAFDPFTPSPGGINGSASVAWTGSAVAFALPGGNSLRGLPSSGDPSLTPAYGGFQNDNAAAAGHPAGYNPNEFVDQAYPSTGSTSPIYPHSDLKRLTLRYAFTPDWFNQAYVAKPGSAPIPGLILLDMKMPKKNGLEALAEIKAHPDLRLIPVVVLTPLL